MKKKIFLCALIAILFAIAASGTLAYFTYEDSATNVITAGRLEIELQEWTKNPDGSLSEFADVGEVVPGATVSKIVQVKNTGGHTAWVRIAVRKSITLAEGREGQADLSLVQLDLNTEKWTEKDGFYYYNVPLQPGEVTEPLFTEVTFAENMGNLYQESSAVISVVAQATQTTHNGQTVFEAAGWPALKEDEA